MRHAATSAFVERSWLQAANFEKQRKIHWRQTELFFDEHCLEEVAPATVVKVRLVILLTTLLSGLDSVIFALGGVFLSHVAADQVKSQESLLFLVVSNVYGLLLTVAEIVLMTLLTTLGAGLLARVAKASFPHHLPTRRPSL